MFTKSWAIVTKFGARCVHVTRKIMEDEMQVEAKKTKSAAVEDEKMEVDFPQLEKKIETKGTSVASTSSGKQSKAFELPWLVMKTMH